MDLTNNTRIKNEFEAFLKSTKKEFDIIKTKELQSLQPIEQVPVKYITKMVDKLESLSSLLDPTHLYEAITLSHQITKDAMLYYNLAVCRFDGICVLNLDKTEVKQAKKAYGRAKETMLENPCFDNIRDYITKAKILYFAENRNVMYMNRVLNDLNQPEIQSLVSKVIRKSIRTGGHVDAHLLNILESTFSTTIHVNHLTLIKDLREYMGQRMVELQESYNKILTLIVYFNETYEKN